MFEATVLTDLSAQEMLTAVEEVHRAVMEREDFILVMACDWADRHCPESVADQGRPSTPGAESTRRFGGEGTPEVLEFAPTELGLPLQMSGYAANQLIADSLDLRHRLPKLWTRVVAGQVEAWKARKVAAATRHLSRIAAGMVDEAVAESVSRMSWSRFKKLMDGKIIEADPDVAQTRADREARARFVRTGRVRNGMMTLTARGPAVQVLGLMAMVERMARIYASFGDTTDLDTRRSKALFAFQNFDEAISVIAASEGVDLSAFDPEPSDDDPFPTATPTNTDTDADADTEADPDTEADGNPAGDADTGAVADTKADADSGADADVEPGADTGSGDADTGGDAETRGDWDAEADDAGRDAEDDQDQPGDDVQPDPTADRDKRPESAEGPADADDDQDLPGDKGSLDAPVADPDTRPEPVEGPAADVDDDQDLPTDMDPTGAPPGPGGPSRPPDGSGPASGENSAPKPTDPEESASTGDQSPSSAPSEPEPPPEQRGSTPPGGTRVPPDHPGPGENSAHNRPDGPDQPDDPCQPDSSGTPLTGDASQPDDPGQPDAAGQADDDPDLFDDLSRFDPESVGPSAAMAKRVLAAVADSGLDPEKIGSQYTVYAHFASEHLTYNGPVRLEGVGPQTLQQFIDHLDPLARVTVKPVLDLNTKLMPVDGYEIPAQMRELHHLNSPGDKFPFSSYTGRRMDIDHTLSYLPLDEGGTPGQTSQANTGPLARFSHRVATHGGATPRQPRPGTYVWRTRNGYVCIADHRGSYNLGTDAFAQAVWNAAVDLNAERQQPDADGHPKTTTLPADEPTGHPSWRPVSIYDCYDPTDPPDPEDQEFDDCWPPAGTAA